VWPDLVAAPTLFCRHIGVSDITGAVKYWERIAASDIHYLQEPESTAYLFFSLSSHPAYRAV
jgi:hypothetical protein